MIFFSVVIPLYNKEHMIKRTINSVLAQTFTNFEIVIVDDGSTDGSISIIRDSFDDSRIKIVRQVNQGVSVARNTGVEVSRGEYIAFLDADDEWLPSYLDTINTAIQQHPKSKLIHIPALHRDIVNGFGAFFVVKRFANKVLNVNLFESAYNICAQTSGIVVERELFNYYKKNFEGNGFPADMTYEEDMTCFFSIALLTKSLYIGKPLSIRNYNVKGQLVMRKNPAKLIDSQMKYLNYLLANYKKAGNNVPYFMDFYKYELRTRISGSIKENLYKTFVYGLSKDVKFVLSSVEWAIYNSRLNSKIKGFILKILRLGYFLKKRKIGFV